MAGIYRESIRYKGVAGTLQGIQLSNSSGIILLKATVWIVFAYEV
jgi:hypothetical protein